MKEGWKYERIGDISLRITDGSHNPPKGIERSEFLMLSSQNVQDGFLDLASVRFLPKESFDIEHKRTQASAGDVLLTIVGTIGRSCVLKGDEGNITFQRSVAIIKPKDDIINPYYLMYCFRSFTDKLNDEAHGAAQKGLYLKQLANITIPRPPLPEQQQIVDFLDAEFAKIDELKNQAEQSLQNAKDLFQAALKEMLTPKEGWKEYAIDEVVDEGSPISYGIVQPGDGVDKGVPVVRPVDLTCKQLTDTSSFKKTTEEIAYSYKRTLLKGKEILMCVRGTTGVISLTSDTLVGCNVTRGIVPFQIEDDLLRNFLYYTIKAPIAADYIQIKTQGAALKQINIADVKKIPIWLPSAEEQKSIVSKLEIIDKSCKQLQSNYTRTIQLCADLKQALLRQVFE